MLNNLKKIGSWLSLSAFIWGALGTLFGNAETFYINESKNFNITYDFIYFGLMSIGLPAILYIAFTFFKFLTQLWKKNKHVPNISISDSLEWVINSSDFGTSLQKNQHGKNDAVKAVKNCIITGELKLFGTNEAKPLSTKIDKREICSENLEIFCIQLVNFHIFQYHI